MSLSNQKLSNPATKFIEFKGDKGIFQYWDSEKEQNIELQLPCYFIILDQLSTITGYSEKYNCGIYSNEIHSLNDEILNVKSFKGDFSASGKYTDIKAYIKEAGGRFCKSVYVMTFNQDGETELVNFKFSGASFSAFLDAKINPNKSAVCILNEFTEKKKGSIYYKEPVFKKYTMKDSLLELAIEMDKELQTYLNQYKKEKKEKQIEKIESYDNLPENDPVEFEKQQQNNTNAEKFIDDLPF